ncbi:MAG: glutaredoxin family protein [Alkalinema sp. CAN_BIN05]|nr:glutaredoxin family protein [Alkalinema sp. CAN_BIN05]
MNLILYSKPGCHLCEGLEEKLSAVTELNLKLDVRDITQDDAAFQAYQYEIPVLYVQTDSGKLLPTPRQSPRASIAQITQMLQPFTLQTNDTII